MPEEAGLLKRVVDLEKRLFEVEAPNKDPGLANKEGLGAAS